MEEWKEGKSRKKTRNIEEEEWMIREEEIRGAAKKMKLKKAAGINGISTEAWKFAGKGLWRKLVELIKLMGRRRVRPEE